MTRLLLGTHTFGGSGDGARRQAAAMASLLTLDKVDLANVQFADAPHHVGGIRTLPVLTRTSTGVTGRRGPVKPLVSEILDALAAEAAARGLAYFCLANGDIHVTQDAVDWMLASGREGYVFSRQDFDGATGRPTRMELAGTDVFGFSVAWWRANGWRFRPYILGEGGWDNVYTAVVLCHANALIENRRPFIRHEAHTPGPMPSPQFGQYIRMLAAFDAQYFSRWVTYYEQLVPLRERGASADDEAALARRVFVSAASPRERAVQQGRNVKARIRYEWWRRRAGPG